jgi:hypothetical protein
MGIDNPPQAPGTCCEIFEVLDGWTIAELEMETSDRYLPH